MFRWPRMTLIDAQVAHYRAQRVVPKWPPRNWITWSTRHCCLVRGAVSACGPRGLSILRSDANLVVQVSVSASRPVQSLAFAFKRLSCFSSVFLKQAALRQ